MFFKGPVYCNCYPWDICLSVEIISERGDIYEGITVGNLPLSATSSLLLALILHIPSPPFSHSLYTTSSLSYILFRDLVGEETSPDGICW